jgi:vacuolar-type H+-ATPase subunit F/Vma7
MTPLEIETLIDKLSDYKFDIIIIKDNLIETIEKALNSNPDTQILKELWTSLDDSKNHLTYAISSLESLLYLSGDF